MEKSEKCTHKMQKMHTIFVVIVKHTKNAKTITWKMQTKKCKSMHTKNAKKTQNAKNAKRVFLCCPFLFCSGFSRKTLVHVNVKRWWTWTSFNVQRDGVRGQRSHDHVHVLLNPGNRRFARPLHTLRVPARVCRSTTTTRLCLFRILLLPSHQL